MGGIPIAVLTPQQYFYVFADQIDTPLVLADPPSGFTAWDWRNHDPFGNNVPRISTLLPGYDHRFPGQIADAETGLFYNYFRDYDPQTGRYVESDPIGLGGGINTYGYVFNGPINYVDPDGLQAAVPVPTPLGPALLPVPVMPANPSLPSPGQNSDWFKPSPSLPTWNLNGIIPPQDFPNGISWPPKKTPENCYVEVPPPKLPPPKKPDCETVLDVCKKSVQAGAKGYLSKFVGYGMCMTAYLTCKKVIGGGHE